jgi:RNA polymerase sigma-70 factor (ECF subfamily)
MREADVTAILSRVQGGDEKALDELLPLVYDELRVLAGNYMYRERPDHTLQPTALVHEAYLRLIDQDRAKLQNRAHFLAIAAKVMRRVLVDHARGKARKKRGGAQQEKVSLDGLADEPKVAPVDVVALDLALERLAAEDPRKAKVVELLYFGGMTAAEAADVLGINSRTVERDWRYSRAWLLREISRGSGRAAGATPDDPATA